MFTCPHCGVTTKKEKKFCGSCGKAMGVAPTPRNVPTSGKSKIQLDKDTVNILLSEFASRDGMELSYDEGRLLVDQGSLKVTVSALPLKDAQFQVAYTGYGTVNFGIEDFRLQPGQVEVDLNVGLG